MTPLVSAGRWAFAIFVPLTVYFGQVAADVWAERMKRPKRRKAGTRKRTRKRRAR